MEGKKANMKNHPQNTMSSAQAVASSQSLGSGINAQYAPFSIFAHNANPPLFTPTT